MNFYHCDETRGLSTEKRYDRYGNVVTGAVTEIASENNFKDIQLHRSILNELGYNLSKDSSILDFGCGEGERVRQYRNLGFKAFGVDIKLRDDSEFLRLIYFTDGYRIPFPDATFDFVYSESVLEHVHNYSDAMTEIRRVLKPGGISLHFFPPKYAPIEQHVFVPFGGIFQNYPWLVLWAFLGVKNSYQQGLKFTEIAAQNYEYLKNHTHYLSKNAIRKCIFEHFHNVIFAEKYLIRHSYGRARRLYPILTLFPFVASIYGQLHIRVVSFRRES